MNLIDKDTLVSEIDERIKKYTLLQQKPEMSDLQEELQNKIDCLNSIKGYIINTIEVKEVGVDLEKELGKYLDANDIEFIHQIKLLDFAKYFFELGIKTQKEE